MTAETIAVVALWVTSAALAVALTVRWFWRYGETDAFSSVVCTTLAGTPGLVILLESLARYIERAATGAGPQAFELWSTLISCFWFLLGPILLIAGIVQRVGLRETPPGTTVVQLLHGAMWGWSTYIGFLFAASV